MVTVVVCTVTVKYVFKVWEWHILSFDIWDMEIGLFFYTELATLGSTYLKLLSFKFHWS